MGRVPQRIFVETEPRHSPQVTSVLLPHHHAFTQPLTARTVLGKRDMHAFNAFQIRDVSALRRGGHLRRSSADLRRSAARRRGGTAESGAVDEGCGGPLRSLPPVALPRWDASVPPVALPRGGASRLYLMGPPRACAGAAQHSLKPHPHRQAASQTERTRQSSRIGTAPPRVAGPASVEQVPA